MASESFNVFSSICFALNARGRIPLSARICADFSLIFEGELASLKRFKDDVKEVRTGYECGLVFEGFNDLQEEDKVEVYIMEEVPR